MPTPEVKKVVTSFGKELTIRRCADSTLFKVEMSGGGRMPKELNGKFTSFRSAEEAIDGYAASGKAKETSDETKSEVDQTNSQERQEQDEEEAAQVPEKKTRKTQPTRRHQPKHQAESATQE